MIRLIYTSLADMELSLSDIQDILVCARENNAKLGITGMLYFNKKYFLQALEGDEEVVMSLYNHIAEDFRHGDVKMINKSEITEAAFAKWDMGYAGVSSEINALLQALSITDESFAKISAEQSLELLLALKEHAES